MTTVDQWSVWTFETACDESNASGYMTLTGYLTSPVMDPHAAMGFRERTLRERLAIARGPGTRRFAENAFHTLLAVTLLAVIVGLCLAARGLTP